MDLHEQNYGTGFFDARRKLQILAAPSPKFASQDQKILPASLPGMMGSGAP